MWTGCSVRRRQRHRTTTYDDNRSIPIKGTPSGCGVWLRTTAIVPSVAGGGGAGVGAGAALSVRVADGRVRATADGIEPDPLPTDPQADPQSTEETDG